MHRNVVGVPVAAIGPVGEDGVGLDGFELVAEKFGRLLDAIDQCTRVFVRGRARHTGVAEMPETAQLNSLDAQGIEGIGQFAGAETTELIMIGQTLVRLTNDLAVLAQGERNDGDFGAACG